MSEVRKYRSPYSGKVIEIELFKQGSARANAQDDPPSFSLILSAPDSSMGVHIMDAVTICGEYLEWLREQGFATDDNAKALSHLELAAYFLKTEIEKKKEAKSLKIAEEDAALQRDRDMASSAHWRLEEKLRQGATNVSPSELMEDVWEGRDE